MEYLLFIVGFFLLIGGAEWLVEGSTKLANKLGVSSLIVGLTIVAFGTSLPELIVSLFSINSDATGLAVGNILGSNIANTLLILGIIAVITPVYVHRVVVWREVLFNILASVMLLLLVIGSIFLGNEQFVGLTRLDGIILTSYFILFMVYAFRKNRLSHISAELKKHKQKTAHPVFLTTQIVAGSLGLLVGGKWIVDGAIELSATLGISEGFIGLTIVAVGTSLPELAASVAAIRKNNIDIALGNVVGSNLFNILWVLGITAIIYPIEFDAVQVINTGLVALVSVTLFGLLTMGKHRHQLSRFEGVMLLSFYAIYLGIIFFLINYF